MHSSIRTVLMAVAAATMIYGCGGDDGGVASSVPSEELNTPQAESTQPSEDSTAQSQPSLRPSETVTRPPAQTEQPRPPVQSVKPPAQSQPSTRPPAGVAGTCAPSPASSLVANVRDPSYGAAGNGSKDDTAAIQRAIQAIAGTGGVVRVPRGTYKINLQNSGNTGLVLRSNMTLELMPGAILKAAPTSSASYTVVSVRGVQNVNIVGGGVIEGERDGHSGTSGEAGHGILVSGSSGVAIDNITSRNNWGDGIYIGETANSDIKICNVVADNNRRQGLTITLGSNIIINGSDFSNTNGRSPELGFNIEPNLGQTVRNVTIRNSRFFDNAGGGAQMGVAIANTGKAFVEGVVFENNIVEGNGYNPAQPMPAPRAAVEVSNVAGTQILDNEIINNIGYGLRLSVDAARTLVEGNWVEGTRNAPGITDLNGGGIALVGAPNSVIRNNTVTGNQGYGIRDYHNDRTIVIENNDEYNNG